jgi:transposase
MKTLNQIEIKKRLQKLSNYERVLYPLLKERSDKLRNENRRLKEEIRRLHGENKHLEKIQLELEELREILYGRKQQERKNRKIPLPAKDNRKGEKPVPKRKPESYRRAIPKPEDITGEIRLDISVCPDCGEKLTNTRDHISYREDLEDLDLLLENAKTVTKRIVESGYCNQCQKRKKASEIPKQLVEIGRNTKAMIVYLHVLLGLSHKETEEHLNVRYGFNISEGMISKSLEEQSNLLRPFYSKIYKNLLQETACHYDESSWDVQIGDEGNHVWVKTGTESNLSLFWFGKSRGKGVAEKLRGDITDGNVKNQVGISDDYGAYRNMFLNHQLCWAHPHRKLRDLAESGVLKKDILKHCKEVYEKFSLLYELAREAKEKFNSGGYKTEEEKKIKEEELSNLFDKITVPNKKDPDKLQRIRKSLAARKDRYFTFLRFKNIPLDNNKAERSLRRVVLKRKKSFGSRSQKGANVLSVLYSVVFSIYWSHPPEEFFQRYQESLNLFEGTTQ